ncbi:MAG: hypothetical protein QXT27_07485 [Pyrobaculum sp.]
MLELVNSRVRQARVLKRLSGIVNERVSSVEDFVQRCVELIVAKCAEMPHVEPCVDSARLFEIEAPRMCVEYARKMLECQRR